MKNLGTPNRIRAHNAFVSGVRRGIVEAEIALRAVLPPSAHDDLSKLLSNIVRRDEFVSIPKHVEVGIRKSNQRKRSGK